MGGRHRHRTPDRGVRWLVGATVPVLAAAGVTAAVVLGSGAVAVSAPEQPGSAAPALAAGQAAPVAAPAVAALAGELPDGSAAVLAASRASTSAGERAAANRRAAAQAAQADRDAADGVCEPDAPPRFDDPDHPDEITNRDCGYVDGQGRARSHDPWIDGQLLDAAGD